MWIRIFKAWLKWHKNWDGLCNQCGRCCYTRSQGKNGEVIIHYNSPCENLDPDTHLCRVFDDRFRKCDHCGKVNLYVALFHPTLPKECAYRKTFRLWDK